MVVAACLAMVETDLHEYKDWKKNGWNANIYTILNAEIITIIMENKTHEKNNAVHFSNHWFNVHCDGAGWGEYKRY